MRAKWQMSPFLIVSKHIGLWPIHFRTPSKNATIMWLKDKLLRRTRKNCTVAKCEVSWADSTVHDVRGYIGWWNTLSRLGVSVVKNICYIEQGWTAFRCWKLLLCCELGYPKSWCLALWVIFDHTRRWNQQQKKAMCSFPLLRKIVSGFRNCDYFVVTLFNGKCLQIWQLTNCCVLELRK